MKGAAKLSTGNGMDYFAFFIVSFNEKITCVKLRGGGEETCKLVKRM